MKSVRYVCVLMLTSITFLSHTRAAPEPEENLNDPDGIPLAVLNPEAKASAKAVAAARQQQAEKMAQENKDWLVHSYEERLRSRDEASIASQQKNIYDRISANPDLARLAGIPYVDSSAEEQKAALLRATPRASGLTLRPDPANSASPLSSMTFRSVVPPPLSGLNTSDSHAPVVSGPGWQSTAYSSPQPLPPRTNSNRDSLAMDTPGRLAADSHLLDKNSTSVSFDMGDEPLPQNISNPSAAKLELPLKTNAERVQRIRTNALGASAQPEIKPVQLPPPEDVKPPKMAPPSPTRSQVGDPRDIYAH